MSGPEQFRGFKAGQPVRMLVGATGCLPDGSTEVTYPAGSPGEIIRVVDFGSDQGIGIEVAIWSHEPDLTIVNLFDELDGDLTQFFEVRS